MMAKASKSGQMGLCMRATGKMTRQMAEVDSSMQMAMFTRASGKMIRLMASEDISILMAQSTKVTGKKTSSTVTVRKHGLTVLAMKVTTKTGRRMEEGSSSGQMAQLMMGSSWITTYME